MEFSYKVATVQQDVEALGLWVAMLDDDRVMTGAEIKAAICEAFA
jgi:hypothetical protein